MVEKSEKFCRPVDLSQEDVYDAMREIPGYLDITPADFEEIYRIAFRKAVERMARPIAVSDIMTRDVVAVTIDTPVPEVARMMAEEAVSGIPVLDGDRRVAGMITETDFLSSMGAGECRRFMELVHKCLISKACAASPVRKRAARDIMSAPAITVNERATSEEARKILREKGIDRLPVIDGDGRLAGIVTRADLLSVSHEGGME